MQKQNEYDNKRKKTLRWGYLFAVVALCVFVMFLARIVILQNTNVQEIKDDYINKNYREATLKAARGNLFASDGSILATTVMRYDIYLDFKTMKDTIYSNNIGALTDSLSKMFGKSRGEFRQKFDEQKKKKNQYYTLVKGLDFDQYDRIRNFPIFKRGKNKGGFIVDRNYKRELATSEIGSGTIGMDNGELKSGLEGAFSKYLTGTDGKRLEQRINSSQWKPIDFWKVQEPVDGEDVYTTLDLRIQDIAHSALEKQLINFEAKHGTVIVMEVETGKVRALVNLRRTESGEYEDSYNYALKDNIEPGSTFKTISLLAAMDDGFIDENTTVNVGNGVWTYAKQRISDGHGGGTYDISDVLAKSSNVGTSKLITKYYAEKPQIFLDHLKRWKLFDKMDIELPGITKPKIVTPQNKRWNAATLASISYGYSSNINLLQLTTFYNGVANGGKMLKPLFIDKIMKDGKVMYNAKPEVMVNKMASEKAIKMMTNALTKAVEKGTGRSIFTPNLKMAGKTGTARFEYWLPGPMKYRASFAGFYPADAPKYTCYVMVSEPNTSIGFYGGPVAAPVFKEIAGKTFLKTPQNIEKEMLVDKKVNLNKMVEPNVKVAVNDKQMPNVVGLIGKNIIPQLENLGYRVDYKGVGRIKEQFPLEGTTISKNQRIYLSLQN
ncbi:MULTISPECIES: penicillin-binding transpeptidase domain-containing protein [Chryseobacterium]|jgi:cell division protein FtsI (penicillin-binding protein 3)|uniref:Cell division protein FtsI (Penicillin-binding protein 3) n=1 Tax=Chryseobacterium rhizosphaerae TaxID=395937 RepID=A0AAE3Y7R5_9FLAO|nr:MULTISPECIES: penicillin-binding transpeptidase domain-containing protein [Chryseobacterium]MBL3548646.1 PASTA domain-containing protein [Chryseobacterium sp. KMC2]MDC8102546.1 PASTA domain-containing protein [Chryseobacterium rhizosphaerae]MDR6526540.1 cell division protein FtsI (penicillin-binding protein 3) [Chryseobacterium rhizosphaerae]MDR6546114.1 cell division protein FtsI (penicillin-binding protein 3) [Chryseobacterium rhizosphaerae]REC77803.1 PASTA domain-containing protein [Chry